MLPTLYEDETEEMAFIRYSILSKAFANRKTKEPKTDVQEKAAKLAEKKLLEELTADYVHKPGQRFLCRRDGVPEYAEYKDGAIIVYSGSEVLCSARIKYPINIIHREEGDTFCLSYGVAKHCFKMDRTGALSFGDSCSVHHDRYYFSQAEKDTIQRYKDEIAAELIEKSKAKRAAKAEKYRQLHAKYSHAVKLLSLRTAIRKQDYHFEMRELPRVPRPTVTLGDKHYCFQSYILRNTREPIEYVTPEVTLFNHNKLAVLELKGESIKLPNLTVPLNWTINHSETGIDLLSISTVTGWTGFNLTTGERCKAIPYQLDGKFRKVEQKGRCIISTSMILIVDDNTRFMIKCWP